MAYLAQSMAVRRRLVTPASTPLERETARVRRLFDTLAPSYDWEIALWEKVFYGDSRRWVCSQAVGETLEIGVGTGRNLPFYPHAVRLTGIDLSEAMIARARRRAQQLDRPVRLSHGDAHALDFSDRTFDTVVFSITLCAVPDPRRALAEAKRVLKPRGRLLLFEHARSSHSWLYLLQRLAAAASFRLGGHYLLRDPLNDLARLGFEIERSEYSTLGIVQRARARRRDPAKQ